MKRAFIGWRIRAATRAATHFAACRVLGVIAAVPVLFRVPRPWVALLERRILSGPDADLFDPLLYLARNEDVAAEGVDPFYHYLTYGWDEGRDPNAHLQDASYRVAARLSPRAPVSALAHFAAVGGRRGVPPAPGAPGLAVQDDPELTVARLDAFRALVRGKAAAPIWSGPDLDEVLDQLDKLCPRPGGAALVDVVMPVYSGRAETLNAIAHVLRARCETRHEMVVIQDCSPDIQLAADLRSLADRELITLIENDSNLGFPASINRGTALHPDRDVIWLNADTEVYGDWVDRLRKAAYAADGIATVTPLTNNGTIASYPVPDADNPGDLGRPLASVDQMAARVNSGFAVPAPTCVGFATYVRRAALDEVGPLDAAAFGRGYGEENDFSQRAIAAGWRNVIAADVFVRHFGATSFKDGRAVRVEQAMQVVTARFPRYLADVGAFKASDPLAEARARLDRARLRSGATRAVLLVTHSLGGGTAQHVHEEIARLEAAGLDVYVMSGGAGGRGTVHLGRAGHGPMPSLASLAWDSEKLWCLLASLGLKRADIHHLIDFPVSAPEVISRRFKEIGVPFRVKVHDYFPACPRINMADQRGRYCGEPGPAACRRCLMTRGSPVGRVDVGRWRRRYGVLLRGAAEVVTPDGDVARRLRKYWPWIEPSVEPHDDSRIGSRPNGRRPGPLRIAVIGAIGPIKGIDAILGLADHIARSGDASQITVIGYTHDDMTARNAGIDVTGPYLNRDVETLIERTDPDVIWIPSIWPETYCYTLSIAFRSGRPVAAFDLGAQASRIRRTGRGRLIPLEEAFKPAKLLWHLYEAAAVDAELIGAA